MKWFSRKHDATFGVAERLVLDAVGANLPLSIRPAFDESVRSVNLIQRHADGKEVNMYRMLRGKVTFPSQRLTDVDSDFPLATVVLQNESAKPKVVAKVWTVGGHLFQIVFNAPIKRMSTAFQLVSIELHPAAGVGGQQRLGAIPERLAKFGEISRALPPLSEQRRDDALSWIAEALPSDYLDLMKQIGGFQIRGWTVLDLESVFETPGMRGTYVLAESLSGNMNSPGRAIISRAGSVSLITLDELEEEPSAGTGFIDALAAELESDPEP